MYQAFILLVLAGTIIGFRSIMIVYRESASYNQKLLLLTTSACFITILCYFFEITSKDLETMLVCAKIEYLGKSVAMYTYLIFIGNYCKISLPKWVYKSIRTILALLVLSVFTAPLHDLYYKSIQIGYDGWFPYFHVTPGPMYFIFMFLMNAIIMCYNVMLIIRLRSCAKSEKKKLVLLLLSGILPPAAFLLVAGFGWEFIDMVPIGYAISCSFLVVLIKKYGLLDTVQIAKENIMENTREGLIVVDTAYEVLYANSSVEEIFPEIYHIKKEEEKEKFKVLFQEPESVHTVGNMHFEIRISKLYENNQLKGYLAWIFNMEFIDKYTNQILELKQEAERANIAKSAFLANMSHEIRTPMNAILGFAELIVQKARSKEIFQHASDIKRSSQSLLHIINGILDISKIESGKKETISEIYYTQSLIRDVLVIMGHQAKEKGLHLYQQMNKELPFQMEGDCSSIREALVNVLGNAIKYTEIGSVTLAIDCTEEGNGYINLRFIITDTGRGIKQEDLDRIFDKFTRFEKDRGGQKEGTGLGMAITKALVEMLNGTLDIQSTYGEGTCVTIVIPQKVHGERRLDKMEEEEIVENEEIRQQDFVANADILIVDDNDMNLTIVSGFLKRYAIRTETAINGYEALEMLKTKNYDLIFMDHMMPGIDGVETMHRIRALGEKYCRLPIIALTANAILGVKEEMIQEGFHDYLSKPLDIVALEKILLKYLPQECVTITQRNENKVDRDKMFELQESMPHLDIQEGIRYCGGMAEQFEEILRVTLKRGNEKQSQLVESLEKQNYEQFIITVHALKSTAASIGAKELSEFSAGMEAAGKQGDYKYLSDNINRLMLLHTLVIKEIELYFDKKDFSQNIIYKEEDTISESELIEILNNVETLLKDFEFDKAAYIVESLTDVAEDKQANLLEELLSNIQSLEIEKAMLVIEELKKHFFS